MSTYKWSMLNTLELSKYAEYYCKMLFTLHGYKIYLPEIDDHGVDFIAKSKDDVFFEVQVKSIRKTKYVYIPEDKIKIDKNHLVCLVVFKENKPLKLYIFPATVWKKANSLFVYHAYDKPGQSNKPEWGVNVSDKNIKLLEKYNENRFFKD